MSELPSKIGVWLKRSLHARYILSKEQTGFIELILLMFEEIRKRERAYQRLS